MIKQQTVLNDKTNLKEPKFYAVIIYNDEITTMDFVVYILNHIFNKTIEEATKLMLEIHESGKGIAGVYNYDIAVTKKNQADILAIENNYPLKIVVKEN